MYAIVEIAGLQYKVAKKQRVFVHRLEANEGDSVEFAKVLLIDNDGKITVGSPAIDGARVAAKVLSHLKGDKVIVFDSNKCVVHVPDEKLVVLQGLEDFIVADTKDVLLICKKEKEQAIKEYVAEVKRNTGERFL